MKKSLAWALILAFLISVLPCSAIAAKISISLGGKVGLMQVGSTVTLKPKLKGVSASQLWWNSSDTSVASVSGGKIQANKPGKAVISVSGAGTSAKCGVVVLPKTVEIGVGESYSLPYGTVESYTMKNNSIASVSKRGVIAGKKAGNTLLRVKYNKQCVYVQVKVNSMVGGAEQSAAAALECVDETNQIVLVDYISGSKANLSIHEKKSGVWKQIYSCTAYLGKNGIDKTKEGDKKTPTGTFNLNKPFGIKDDPGANMKYTKVNKYHYWCGTSGSEYYNQLEDMREVDRKYTSSDEYLIKYKGVYNYCMFIDYNRKGEANKGSCIFLHCTGSNKYTAGCIAVPEKVMKKIIQWAEPGAKIVIR